jgi:hypothetical protein
VRFAAGNLHRKIADEFAHENELLVILLPNTTTWGCTMFNSFSTTVETPRKNP